MSFDALRVAVTNRFNAEWSGSNVAYGANHDFDPPATETWVRLNVVPFDTENAAVGKDFQRTSGEIVVQCFAPRFSGEKVLNDMVDEVRDIFQNQGFSGVDCLATKLVNVGVSGDWYQFNANTEFRYDVTA